MVRLNEVLAEVLRQPSSSLTDGMTMSDIETWDSLCHMELIVAIEKEFELQLSFEEIATMQSIGSIRSLISTKLG